jgi:hypothetical protein
MSIATRTRPDPDPFSVDNAKTDESELYARAEQTIRRGKRFVISGFVVAVLGIVAYCVVTLIAAMNPEVGSTLLKHLGWLAWPMLGIIGLGTLLWLVGSFIELKGAMDIGPTGPDLD